MRYLLRSTALIFMLLFSGSGVSVAANAVPDTLTHEGQRTGTRWEMFWEKFKRAAMRNDRATLFAMTLRSGFSWEMDPPLDLPLQKGAFFLYDIADRESFDRVYAVMFTDEIMNTILFSKPCENGSGGYDLYHFTRTNEIFALVFVKLPSGGYRFSGSYRCLE